MIVQRPERPGQSAACAAERGYDEGGAAERGTMVGKTSVVTVILTHSLQVPPARWAADKVPEQILPGPDRKARLRTGGDQNLGRGITSPATR